MALDATIVDGVFRVTFQGNVGISDLQNLAEASKKVEAEGGVSPNFLTDLSAVENAELDFGVIQEFAAMRMTMTLKNRIKSAIVATQPLQLGFARMYQTLTNHPQINMRIFKDRDSAWKWLQTEDGQADTQP